MAASREENLVPSSQSRQRVTMVDRYRRTLTLHSIFCFPFRFSCGPLPTTTCRPMPWDGCWSHQSLGNSVFEQTQNLESNSRTKSIEPRPDSDRTETHNSGLPNVTKPTCKLAWEQTEKLHRAGPILRPPFIRPHIPD